MDAHDDAFDLAEGERTGVVGAGDGVGDIGELLVLDAVLVIVAPLAYPAPNTVDLHLL